MSKKPTIDQMRQELMANGMLSKQQREANKAKFLEPSKIKDVLYHGSKEPNIVEFKTRKQIADENYPDDPSNDYRDERNAVFLSPDPKFTRHFSVEGYTDTGQAPTTYPVHVQARNPFDFDKPKHRENLWKTYHDIYYNPESELYAHGPHDTASEKTLAETRMKKRIHESHKDENNWPLFENPNVQQAIQDMGHDSFYIRERGTKNLGVYDPSRIKSAIGNRGTYDTTNPDITKAKGGVISQDAMQLAVMNKGGQPKHHYPYAQAHETARLNAIKMLGLHEHNTAQDRAKAMGYDLETFHGTDAPNIESLDPERTKIVKGVFSTTHPRTASRYAEDNKKRAGEKSAPNIIPLLLKSASHKGMSKFDINTINSHRERGDKGAYRPEMQTAVTFDPSHMRSRFAAFDPSRQHESDLLAAKGGVVSILRKHGRPVDSDLDATRKMSNGHRVFIAHEQDEKPREITSVSEMHGYTPDQIYTVDPKHFAKGGSIWNSPDWKPHSENDLLQPIGASRMVGDEKLLSQDNTFSHGLSEFPSNKKSYRYLYHGEDKNPIGSMQIQTSGPRSKKAVIQNLYVAEANRRQGIASKLLDRARQDFDVKHSNDLTTAGKAFAKAKKAKGGRIKGPQPLLPKETVKAYKLFRVDQKQPGKLFPLFVDANTPVEKDKWVEAKVGEMTGNKVKSKIGPLAYRPGWHAGDLPVATHIGEKSDNSLTAPDRRPKNQVWAEVEMPNDVDWQSEANRRGTNKQGKLIPVKAHITDQIPLGGHYRYKTNPNMTGNWLIGGAMKVNRVLPDEEVQKINKKAKVSDLPRSEPINLKDYGFRSGGNVQPLLPKFKE